jgi:predicted nucleic acid-binding protein
VALIVLDASVVIAHLDPDDAGHARAVSALTDYAAEDLRLPASAYAETLVTPARRGRLAETRARIQQMFLTIVPIDEAVAEAAAVIRSQQPALRLPDALVIACGDVLNAALVLTADHRWAANARVTVLA